MITRNFARRMLTVIYGTDRAPNILHPLYYFVRAHQRTLLRHRTKVSGTCLDIGCGDRFYEKFYAGCYARYIGIDYEPATAAFRDFRKPDAAADGRSLPLQGSSVDTVLLIEVIEHVPTPSALLAEVGRVLKPGGRLILTTPLAMPEHGEPFDYFRYTRFGLAYLLEEAGFQVTTIEGITSLGGVISYFFNTFFVAGTFAGDNRIVRYAKMVGAPLFLLSWAMSNAFGILWDVLFPKSGYTLNYFVLAEKR